MEFLNLKKEYNFFKSEIQKNVNKVLNSGRFLLGNQLEHLEENFAKFIGVKYAVGVKNCTDAITIVVKNFCKKDTVVILPNFGAYPTAVAVKNVTNNIYYVDVDKSMTIDVTKLPKRIKNGIIIPVHLFGNNCRMKEIMTYANRNNHIVIEDCAQATGSGCGAQGHYSVFSFYPTKPLASMGDGGMICSNYDISKFKKTRFYGQSKTTIEHVGVNSRMDEIQCAVINSKLRKFQKLNERRIAISNEYRSIVENLSIKINSNSVYHQFIILIANRNVAIKKLQKYKIPYMIHYPYHVSEILVLKGIYNKVNYRINNKILSLPCNPFLSRSEINRVKLFLKKL